MANAGREMSFEENQYGGEYAQIDNLVFGQLGTDLDRSQLGIPAAVDDFPRLCSQSVPNTRHTATSQSSSWDTISGTSNTESYSFLSDVPFESVPVQYSATNERTVAPQITLSGPQVQPVQHGNVLNAHRSGQHSYGGHRSTFQALQRVQTDFDTAFDIRPSASPSNHSHSSSGSFANQSPQGDLFNDQAYDPISPFSDLALSPGLAGFNSFEYRPRDTGNLEVQNTEEPIPQQDFIDNQSISTIRAPSESQAYPQADVDSSIAPISRGRKRKGLHSSSSPKRQNLNKINVIRGIGACIMCRFMHEPVGFECICLLCLITHNLMKCSEGETCGNCLQRYENCKVWQKQPCVRMNLKDASTHRTGRFNSSTSWSYLISIFSCSELPKWNPSVEHDFEINKTSVTV